MLITPDITDEVKLTNSSFQHPNPNLPAHAHASSATPLPFPSDLPLSRDTPAHMERFTSSAPRIARLEADACRARRTVKRKRTTYDAAIVRAVTDECRQSGVAAGLRAYNARHGTCILEETARHWLHTFKQRVHGEISVPYAYHAPAKRGRNHAPAKRGRV
jgi:hypothetical protein